MTPLLPDDLAFMCSALEARAARLRQAHVLITGASGFFGQWLTEALVALDKRFDLKLCLTLVARDGGRLRQRSAHLLGQGTPITILEQDVRELLLAEQPTHVVHAAASASAALNDVDPGEMISVIVDGTRRVLAATDRADRFVYISSGAVYGAQASLLVDEDCVGGPDISSPRSAYAEGKRLAEVLCAVAAQRSSRVVTTARAFAFVGPWLPLDTHFAVGNFLRDALAGAPIVVQGDGMPVRSYLYAAELAVWTLSILLDGHTGRAYNVGSDQPTTIASLAITVGGLFGVPVDIRGTAPAGVPPHRYVPSVRRAHEELGLAQTISLQDALLRTARWHRSRRL
jgi:dTDP-glucose 4,6-dehydratase